MMPSLFSAVSGLKSNQEMMDVIGNNIANVNTPGFKSSSVNFADLLSQTMKGASLPTSTTGGTNPIQIGQGTNVASVDTNFTGGSLQQTGNNTDLGINGDGLFILGSGSNQYYTRDGDFSFDASGNLVSNTNGMNVKGWMANSSGTISTSSTPTDIGINLNASTPAQATSSMVLSGNLNSNLNNGTLLFASGNGSFPFSVTDGDTPPATGNWQLSYSPAGSFNTWNWTITDANTGSTLDTGTVTLDSTNGTVTNITQSPAYTGTVGTFTIQKPAIGSLPNAFSLGGSGSITTAGGIPALTFTPPTANVIQPVYDALGNQYSANIAFTKNSVGDWNWSIQSITDSAGNTYTPSAGGTGSLQFSDTGSLLPSTGTGFFSFTPTGSIAPVSISLNFSALTQDDAAKTAAVQSQNGYTSGTLQSYTIDQSGTITGSFSNGVTQALGQIALANFPNPSGLSNAGSNLYTATANSGTITVQSAGTGSLGTIKTGSLEMSNVDLSQEMSNMIIAQSGFDANSKVITTDDQLMQTLVNMIPA